MSASPKLRALFARCVRELSRLDADWAVGGAFAMAAHGYTRETRDIDLFIGDDAREPLLAALRAHGVAVEEIVEDIHYAAIPDRRDPEARVDLLFPSSEPDVSAVMAARPALVLRRKVPVWPLHLIVANKLLSERAKDAHDLVELRQRGLIDAGRVLEVLQEMKERGAIERLRRLVGARQRGARRYLRGRGSPY